MDKVETPRLETILLSERNGLRLTLVRRPARDIGDVIQTPESVNMISGVGIEVGTVYPDDRGYFAELFRLGASALTKPLKHCETLQISLAASYPGTVKAVHYHFEQTDYWAPIQG